MKLKGSVIMSFYKDHIFMGKGLSGRESHNQTLHIEYENAKPPKWRFGGHETGKVMYAGV